MNKLELDIMNAQILISELFNYSVDDSIYNMFNHIYPFSTENIKGYYSKLDLEDKDILTIGASGDHAINLELENVKSVDYFDINPFTKYYYELKKAAIKALTYEEFLEFFCYDDYPKTFKKNNKAFNIELYRKITPYLIGDTKLFWDSLYIENTGIDIRTSSLFSKDEEPLRVIKKSNSYLEKETYELLKEKLTLEPYFYRKNIKELAQTLTKKYDIIMLSNIAQYLETIFKKDHLECLKKIIIDLSTKLNEDGIIIVSYLYDFCERYDFNKIPLIYNLEEVRSIIGNLEIIAFEGIQNLKFEASKNIRDSILIYKKTK
ncbi:MAG: DUF3419 family protein [Lactobacillales bacterium]|nr:DUF3419 family protein [Lactobacillales bacterium]